MILVKSETEFDKFDMAFDEVFKGIQSENEVGKNMMRWLDKPEMQEVFEEIRHEMSQKKLVEDAKYGHPCSAQELAFRAMKMQAAQGTAHMEGVTADFQASGIAQAQTPAAPAVDTDPDSPEAIEAQAKADVAAYQKMMEVC